jgi:hypothetical protein
MSKLKSMTFRLPQVGTLLYVACVLCRLASLIIPRLFDTLSSMMTAHALYTFFVLNFGNLAADAYIPW